MSLAPLIVAVVLSLGAPGRPLRRAFLLGVICGCAFFLGAVYWVGWIAVVALLVYEHSLVSPDDLSRLDVAFFNVNGYIAVIVLAGVVGGLWW